MEQIAKYAPDHVAIIERNDERRFYGYLHRYAKTGGVLYVGKGTGRRAYNFDYRGHWWLSLATREGVDVEIVKAGLHSCCALVLETIYIHKMNVANEALANRVVPNKPGDVFGPRPYNHPFCKNANQGVAA
jgi:hypothetical protein